MTLCRVLLPLFALVLLGACGGTNKACLKPKPYQASVPGTPIKAPDGLDDLDPVRESSIPDVSPGAATGNPSGDPCLEKPPFARRSSEIIKEEE